MYKINCKICKKELGTSDKLQTDMICSDHTQAEIDEYFPKPPKEITLEERVTALEEKIKAIK